MSDETTGETKGNGAPGEPSLESERRELLRELDEWLETPMLVLAFVWLALFVWEMVWGLNPLLEIAGYVIWALFILDFVLGFTLAPAKGAYLRSNWFKAIALLAPALRVFRVLSIFRVARVARIARVAGATRGLRVVRAVSALNRGMRAFRASVGRRGFRYVAGLTTLVTLVGAAGMFQFERDAPEGLDTYGEALWWTAMVMTTLGSQYWPQTPEGRALCVVLALYAFAVFGYMTATLATFFIGRDAENDDAELAGAKQLQALTDEIAALRDEIRNLARRPPER